MPEERRLSWHDKPIPELATQLSTDVLGGLTPEEAVQRLHTWEPNELRMRDTRVLGIALLLLTLIGYCAVYGVVFPLLWPYRDHPLVWFVLALLSGGHLEELLKETGSLL